MIEVEVRDEVGGLGSPAAEVLRGACAALGLERASVGVLVVSPERMAEINARHRSVSGATDVLAFPVDGESGLSDWPDEAPPPELGDIVLCPATASDPADVLLIHGLLHLLGHDHEVDDGRMLALQAELVAAERAPAVREATEGR